MTATLSRAESWTLLTLAAACLAVAKNANYGNGEPLMASLAFSGLAFSATFAMVRWAGPAFIKQGQKGKDMSKANPRDIPEAMGAVAAAVYFLFLSCFVPFCFYKDDVTAPDGVNGGGLPGTSNGTYTNDRFHRLPYYKSSPYYYSALATLAMTTILGFADDMYDLRWRHKFLIPAIASLPLITSYGFQHGVTFVVVPKFAVKYMPNNATLVDLGYLYYIYMAAVSIFTPHSINILAGINGIEVGQSLVIATLLIINSSLYLLPFPGNPVLGSGFLEHPHPATNLHLLALYLLLPLFGVSLALYLHNRYPARVFVGDTYCYFAGCAFASIAILAHFSKTLLLLLVPQIFNFIYSVPQLFHIIPCPRHRLPKFNARTGLLEPSVTVWPRERPPGKTLTVALVVLEKFRLVQITTDPKDTKRIATTSNLTILNLWLVWFGPMREDTLAWQILSMQMLCGLLGLVVRHTMALWMFGIDNRGPGIV